MVVPLPVMPPSERRRVTANHVFAAGAVLALIALIAWFALSKPASALDRFWSPVLSGGSPVLVCVAYVPVWGLHRDPSANRPPRAEEFVPLTDQFVGAADLAATSRPAPM